jgi:hypothetical protein
MSFQTISSNNNYTKYDQTKAFYDFVASGFHTLKDPYMAYVAETVWRCLECIADASFAVKRLSI